ncbi:hypothetical protein, partial [Streptomyces plicatus]|uniref:hypothetical protein n=1 Tax=Streptomyces plicatus TaxID=1922 RepID=UPI001C70099C
NLKQTSLQGSPILSQIYGHFFRNFGTSEVGPLLFFCDFLFLQDSFHQIRSNLRILIRLSCNLIWKLVTSFPQQTLSSDPRSVVFCIFLTVLCFSAPATDLNPLSAFFGHLFAVSSSPSLSQLGLVHNRTTWLLFFCFFSSSVESSVLFFFFFSVELFFEAIDIELNFLDR